MSEAPFWPVATDALIADTTHLTTEEFGAYTLLMIAQWRSNGEKLPFADAKLARIARLSLRSWQRVRPTLAQLFEITPDGWSQKRVAKDFLSISEKIKKNRTNGALGGKAKALKSHSSDVAVANNSPAGSPEQNSKRSSTNQNHNQNHKEDSSLRSESEATPKKGVEIPDWVPEESWKAFLEHRQRLKAPMTDTAKKVALAQLLKLRAAGQHPTDVINQAIYRGWKGLFALKPDYERSTPSAPGSLRPASHMRQPDESNEHFWVRRFRESGCSFWLNIHGPTPLEDNCCMPKEILREFGFLKTEGLH